MESKYIYWFGEITKEQIAQVGGKGANLGELTKRGIRVPPGFCISTKSYKDFIQKGGLEGRIMEVLKRTNIDNMQNLQVSSSKIRNMIVDHEIPSEIQTYILKAYEKLGEDLGLKNAQVAVRSSATAEDLPEASFAGQQDTYLYISGKEDLLKYIKKGWASLWTSRAIYYRERQGFNHSEVALGIVVQKMIDSKKSGVLFTANPINNDRNQMMINASWGLGEAVVSGIVTPDEYTVNKNSLEIIEKYVSQKEIMIIRDKERSGTKEVQIKDHLDHRAVKSQCLEDDEITQLSRASLVIEKLYDAPQDIEWTFDYHKNQLYILQARPITTLKEEKEETVTHTENQLNALVRGLAASPGIISGKVTNIRNMDEIARVEEGDILVTVMTNPDMVPAMRKAAAVITDEGGRTCHAAIVSRELGVPCIVGAKIASKILKENMVVTVDATRGVVYEGKVMQEKGKDHREKAAMTPSPNLIQQMVPITGTKIYMNLGEPSIIEKYKDLPFDGIGLMRTEFIFSNMIGAHPMYLLRKGEGKLFVDKMAEGITKVAQEVYPKTVIVRFSDFRTNEFRGLTGGEEVEPIENNPMIGWRGVSRYVSEEYEEGFRLECRALKKVREDYGLINVWAMLPFVRTTWEVEKVKEIMASEGLMQNSNFKIWIMAEVPAVVFQAEEFAQLVDGFSIGSNDLTQLILGADRDSGILNSMGYFDERNPAVKRAISTLIKAGHKYGKSVSICGQGPSLYPEFAEFLVQEGIDSMSINPDSVDYTKKLVAHVEQKIILNKVRKL